MKVLSIIIPAYNSEQFLDKCVSSFLAPEVLDKLDITCDLCVANIIADVICMFAAPLNDHIVPGGLFICSGIIKEREQEVENALNAADYTILKICRKGEWVAILSRRHE